MMISVCRSGILPRANFRTSDSTCRNLQELDFEIFSTCDQIKAPSIKFQGSKIYS